MYGQIILQKRTFCSTRMSIKEISDVAFGQHRFLLFAEVTKAVKNVNPNSPIAFFASIGCFFSLCPTCRCHEAEQNDYYAFSVHKITGNK